MKFLHIADVHLDSPLKGLRHRAAVPPDVLQDCTRRAFENAIDLAITEAVDFVLIAGDLYDADWKDFSTALFFIRQMRRLDCPCIMVRGNHDAQSVITRDLEPPPNVRVLSSRHADTWQDDALGVAVHGRSFPNRAVPEDLSLSYPPPRAGLFNIGLLHTSAEDRGAHETYAPCTVQGLVAKGYDYWALGHIHARAILHERPPVVFPGNTQGRHVRETGSKGCTLVTVEERRVVALEHRATDVLRWDLAEVDLDGTQSRAEFAERMRFAIAARQGEAEGRPLIMRVRLVGRTSLHAALVADPAQADADARNAAAAVGGDIHIEQVRVATRPVSETAEDVLATLRGAFVAALEDAGLQAELLGEIQALLGQIPYVQGRTLPELPADASGLRDLAPDAWDIVARILDAQLLDKRA
jgi:DNA repair protein SbcD/Mre11